MANNEHKSLWESIYRWGQMVVWLVLLVGGAYTVKAVTDNNAKRLDAVEMRVEGGNMVQQELQQMVARQSKDIEYMRESLARIEKKLDQRR